MLTLITGASSGIGLELARLAAADGDVVITARRSAELEALAASLPCKAHVVVADLSAPEGVQTILEFLDDNDLHVDQLINNAGFGGMGAFHERNWESDAAMIEVNITALTHLAQALIPEMISRGGRIMNVASMASFLPGPGQAVYYATKAYVRSLSEAMSEELKGTGVTATALCPGPVNTEFAQVADMEKTGMFKRAPTGKQVATYGYKAMKKGKVVAIYGAGNKFLAWMMRFIPRSVLRSISAKTLS